MTVFGGSGHIVLLLFRPRKPARLGSVLSVGGRELLIALFARTGTDANSAMLNKCCSLSPDRRAAFANVIQTHSLPEYPSNELIFD